MDVSVNSKHGIIGISNAGGVKMKNKTGKFFQDIQSRKIKVFEYSGASSYYAFVQEKQQKGLVQSVITTNIMISIMEKYVLDNAQIIFIEFMVEDSDLQEEINLLLDNLKKNAAQWVILKQRLLFLRSDKSIDIKRIAIKSIDYSYIFSIMVNGMITITETAYEQVTTDVCHLLEGQIK